jgi:hypothetical protein
MLTDKAGNRLFRKIEAKVIYPENVMPPKMFVQHAPPRQGFNDDSVDQMLMNIADQLDQLYPWWQFKLVPLVAKGRTARYVFTHTGNRAVPVDFVELPPVSDAFEVKKFGQLAQALDLQNPRQFPPQESSDPGSDMATVNSPTQMATVGNETAVVAISETDSENQGASDARPL